MTITGRFRGGFKGRKGWAKESCLQEQVSIQKYEARLRRGKYGVKGKQRRN